MNDLHTKQDVEIIHAEPLEHIVTLGDLYRIVCAMERQITDIHQRMDRIEQIAKMVGDNVTPTMDELRNGPIGKILGLKQDRK